MELRTASRRRFPAVALALMLLPAVAVAQNAVAKTGLYLAVPSPLTSNAVGQIKDRVEAARNRGDARPSTVVFDFNPGDKDATTADFGACYDLAKYVAGLHDLQTVGFVHRKLTGHEVLPALACKELAVGSAAALGDVPGPEARPLTPTEQSGYAEVLGPTRPAHLAVVRKMYDPDVQLRRGRKNGADFYFDLRDRAEVEKKGAIVSDTSPLKFAPDGQIGLFSQANLRELGLAKVSADTRQDLAVDYTLSPASLRDDPLGGRPPVAFRYVLRGQIDQGVREGVRRVVEKVAREKGNVLILQLECGGGDLQAARDLADDLRTFTAAPGDRAVMIVGFVPDKAPDTATAIALGCSEIVMSKRTDAAIGAEPATEAEIGDFSAIVDAKANSANGNPDFWVGSLRQLAELQGYPPLLVDGMLSRDLEIVRARGKVDRTRKRLMTAQEFEADKANWETDGVVKPKGQLLKLSATQAEQLGLARYTTETREPSEVYAKYGLDPSKVRDATPAWLDRFATFLKIPAVTVILVVIGFTGLILEMKVPGTMIPGILAALCFILVFWAHTQFSGQMAVLAGLLFLLGLVLLLIEVFILPGFGASGITGILLILGSLALVTLEKIPQSGDEWLVFGGKMATFLFAVMGATVAAFVVARYLPNVPGANRMILAPPIDNPESESLPGAAQAAGLLGAIGTTVTVLRPAGSVRFGDEFVDVVSDGGYIPAGSRVQVVEVEGTRIVVKEVG